MANCERNCCEEKTTYLSPCNLPYLNVKFIDSIVYLFGDRGINMVSDMKIDHGEKAYILLKADAEKILRLIQVQMDNLTMPQCPLYEEVLDTQMFGLSREIDFAVRLGLIDKMDGNKLMGSLERRLSSLHEASLKK